jgi:hypothetical protein
MAPKPEYLPVTTNPNGPTDWPCSATMNCCASPVPTGTIVPSRSAERQSVSRTNPDVESVDPGGSSVVSPSAARSVVRAMN